jgi:hypothetical protein
VRQVQARRHNRTIKSMQGQAIAPVESVEEGGAGDGLGFIGQARQAVQGLGGGQLHGRTEVGMRLKVIGLMLGVR